MQLRSYQQAAIDALYGWWMAHPGIEQAGILAMPTGSGKSIVIAELTRLLFDTWPEDHPRTLVLVPSKELAEQNAEKLLHLLPTHISLGYYSASVGQKRPDADVIVATIGSVARNAHLLGNIKCVIVDECFSGDTLINTPRGDKRIDELSIGDAVYNASGIGIVQAVSERYRLKHDIMYTVRISDGTSLRVTGSHPFFTSAGWKHAADLERGDGIARIQDMSLLWHGLSTEEISRAEWEGCLSGKKLIHKSQILFDLLFEENGKCDVDSGGKGKDVRFSAKDRASALADWWQRPWNDCRAEGSVFDFERWVDSGACDFDRRELARGAVPGRLQGRHWKRALEDSDRAGREFTLRRAQGTGCEERCSAPFAWVESVSREECRRPEAVYNLHVSGHPSYFAGGVLVHNCHLVNPDGAGMYRQLLRALAQVCQFRVVGLTATPFRGNGVWLTDGEDPLFSGIAHTVTVRELLDAGHLAPLIRPVDAMRTRIDTDGIAIASTGDYATDALAERVAGYLPAAAAEACALAADRRKWIAFTPTVRNAEAFVRELRARDIAAALVCGETPKREREELIADFRAGRLRCLVTVLALATGFDVPDVDAILWLRPTISPVLYVQGAGRGLRPAPGKADCLWLDFTDTTERMGPVDAIRGRKRAKRRQEQIAPFAICDDCGAQVRPASAMFCPECGAQLREEEDKQARAASNAAVMAHQREAKIVRYEVTNVTYAVHRKPGSPDSLRVEYWAGMRIVAREWVCIEHNGFAKAKADAWLRLRCGLPVRAVADAYAAAHALRTPAAVTVNESGKWPTIIKFDWEDDHDHAITA